MAYRRKYDPRTKSGRAEYNRRRAAAKKGWANRGRKKSSGCYIATCVYETYDCPELWTLRRYRDQYLSERLWGRVFIRTYYLISPTIIKWFGATHLFKAFWKNVLDRIVHQLNNMGFSSDFYCDKKTSNCP